MKYLLESVCDETGDVRLRWGGQSSGYFNGYRTVDPPEPIPPLAFISGVFSFRADRPALPELEAEPDFIYHSTVTVGGVRYDPSYGSAGAVASVNVAGAGLDYRYGAYSESSGFGIIEWIVRTIRIPQHARCKRCQCQARGFPSGA